MHRLTKLLIVLLLVLTLGLHWALLQTVAWTGMLFSYAQKNALRTAVSMTFDGEHPCTMCQAIEQGRAAEQQQDQQPIKAGLKLDFGLMPQSTIFTGKQPREWVPSADCKSDSQREAPPKPRPRTTSVKVLS